VIRNNVVYSSVNAISVYKTPNIVIRNNILTVDKKVDPTIPKIYQGGQTIAVPTTGIYLSGSFSVGAVENNQISSGGNGILVDGSQYISVEMNMVSIGNVVTLGVGICLNSNTNPPYVSNHEYVEGNTVTGEFLIGIWIRWSQTDNVVTRNFVIGNGPNPFNVGIQIGGNAYGNTITYNTISGVGTPINDISGQLNTIEGNKIL